jgi:ankyrin repeat protein
LGYACESGHTEVAEILLNAGAHIDEAENEGRTPLMKASRAGHICTVRYLISKGKKTQLLIFFVFNRFVFFFIKERMLIDQQLLMMQLFFP